LSIFRGKTYLILLRKEFAMQAFKQILFPVDLSEVSPKVVPYVREMAEKFEAEVHLLFVARILQHFTSIYVPHPSISSCSNLLTEG